MILALGARGPRFNPRLTQTPIIRIFIPTIPCSQENCIFWELIWKTVFKTDYKNLEHNDYQLLPTLLEHWSSGMILDLRAGGTGFNPRLSPRPDYSVNFWQQLHIRKNTAIFLAKYFEKKLCKTDYKNLRNRALWLSIVDNHLYGTVKGLVAGSSLWVREVAGAIPGCPQLVNSNNLSQQFHVLRNIAFLEKLIENKSAKQITKTYKSEHYHYQLLTTFMGQCSSGMILALVASAPDSIPGCLQLGTIQIIGPNNSMFSSKLHFWEIILKTVCKTD